MEIIRTILMIIIGLVFLKLLIDLVVLLFVGSAVAVDDVRGKKMHHRSPPRSHHHSISAY